MNTKPLSDMCISHFYKTLLSSLWLLFSVSMYAQNHDINLSLINNTIASITVNANSDMFRGDIEKSFVRLVRIPALKDGQLQFTVNDILNSDDILFKLTNEETTATMYGLRLNDFKYYIEDVNGVVEAGTFENGDNFRIIRCKKAIIYMHNSTILSILELDNNNFRILGEMYVDTADQAKVRLEFEPL